MFTESEALKVSNRWNAGVTHSNFVRDMNVYIPAFIFGVALPCGLEGHDELMPAQEVVPESCLKDCIVFRILNRKRLYIVPNF
jgi:hypothetical protein